MKKIITLVFLFSAVATYAQPKLISKAIITTKTTVVAPEEDDNVAPPNTNGGDEVRVMRFFGGDGETKSTTWLKSDLVKTFSESESGRTTIIRDNSKKITTTIMEMMGRKTAFYVTDSDQVVLRKRLDSMMQNRRQNDVTGGGSRNPPTIDISYMEESKKIAGYDCKKAIIITTRSNGKKDSSLVWYIPDLKLQGINSTGGALAGFGGFSPQAAGLDGMDKLNGFPMQYERNMNRGRKMTVVVTKFITDKEVTDKEFEVPKDVELKSMKDMQDAGGPGTFQMRRDN